MQEVCGSWLFGESVRYRGLLDQGAVQAVSWSRWPFFDATAGCGAEDQAVLLDEESRGVGPGGVVVEPVERPRLDVRP